MKSKLMKNIVILKDLPSNLIDEAIIILKGNCKIKSLEISEKNKSSKNNNKDNTKYILQEAEMVINNYISDIKEDKKISKANLNALEDKCNRLKTLLIIIGSIAFVSIAVQIV